MGRSWPADRPRRPLYGATGRRGDGATRTAVDPYGGRSAGPNPGPTDPHTRPARAYAPKAFDFPFTGFAPANRCGGTRSRAGSL